MSGAQPARPPHVPATLGDRASATPDASYMSNYLHTSYTWPSSVLCCVPSSHSGPLSLSLDLSPDLTELLPTRRVCLGPKTSVATRGRLWLPAKAALRAWGGDPLQHVLAAESGAPLAVTGRAGT